MKTDLIELTLGEIFGRSTLNARPDDPNDDISGLAATIEAVGLLQRISVVRVDEGFEVIAGWRRVKALQHLHEIGHFHDDEIIPAALLEGTPDELVAASIAENTERRMLRAPEEAEAFAMLAAQGRQPEDIAHDFGVSVRHVKRRLKLASLAPEAMALWKAEAMPLESARLLCALSHERQVALIEEAQGAPQEWVIKKAFDENRKRSDAPEAVYVGRAAYVQAGGVIEEFLFGEWDYFVDGALLDKLAREKLAVEGEAVREAEGWGALLVDPDWNVALSYTHDKRRDRLDAEVERIGDINSARDGIMNAEGYDPEDPETKAKLASLELEEDMIEQRALLRAIAQDERKGMALFVTLDDDGAPEYQRAMMRKVEAAKAAKASKKSPAGGTSEHGEAPAPQPQVEPTDAHYAALATRTLDEALEEAVRIRPDLALAVLLASLVQQSNDLLRINTDVYFSDDNDLIDELRFARNLPEALIIAAKAPQGDVVVALAAFIGASVLITKDASAETVSAAFKAAALRGSAVREHMAQAFDADRWFAKAPKDDCVAAIVAIEGRNTCEAKKLPQIRLFAGHLAKDRKWLPDAVLRHLPALDDAPPNCSEPAPSLAEAMAQAIEADEASVQACGDSEVEPDAPPAKAKRVRKRKAALETAEA